MYCFILYYEAICIYMLFTIIYLLLTCVVELHLPGLYCRCLKTFTTQHDGLPHRHLVSSTPFDKIGFRVAFVAVLLEE